MAAKSTKKSNDQVRDDYTEWRYVHYMSDGYSADCPACLRHEPHTDQEHDAALRRNFRCSVVDDSEGESDF
jgi:hypothetical protein